MTNRERFCEAFAHVGHRVMGRRLRVFSLRHRFWLEAMESPLVTGGVATLVDLELASRVCAMGHDELDDGVPALLLRGPRWWERVVFCVRLLMRRGAAQREYEAFQNYCLDYGCPPATHGGGGPVAENGKRYEAMPGILGLVTGLVRGSGWAPETVWALNPGAAEWYLAGIFTHRGVDMRLKTEHDEEFEEGLRRMREEAERGED
jgi:hypothetical protein